MPYHIARAALHDFVDRQLTLVESTPLPTDVRDLVADEDLGDDELAAVWLAAGLATQVGLAVLDGPERFVVSSRSGAPIPAASHAPDVAAPARPAQGSEA